MSSEETVILCEHKSVEADQKVRDLLRRTLRESPARSNRVRFIRKSSEMVRLRDKANKLLGIEIIRRFERFTDDELLVLYTHALEADQAFRNDTKIHQYLINEILDERSRRDI